MRRLRIFLLQARAMPGRAFEFLLVTQILFVLVLGILPVFAQIAQKRIYIAPDDHTDYFWSGDELQYRDAFLGMIDYYLDLADVTIDNPTEFQSRWNCDGSFWAWTYERNRTASQFERLIGRVRDGHISFPLNALVTSLGGAPAEAVIRGMYYAGQLERRFDLRIALAVSMENQTLPYGLSSLWAGSGAKYSWKGICQCDTLVSNAWDRENDIYWMTGRDGSRVLMKWNSMLRGNQSMGGYAEARYPADVVEYVDSDPGFLARYPYNIIGAFGKGWDDLTTLTDEFVTVAKSKTNSARTVIVSNQHDFFEDFESTFGLSTPSQSSSFGNEWDLYCVALAEVSGRVKRAVEKLRGAEAMATLVTFKNPDFMNGREGARDLAWMNLGLFWEHNFGMVYPPTGSTGVQKRIAWQRRLVDEMENYIDALQIDARDELGRMIPKNPALVRFFVFNPLSWTRTDIADLPYSDTGAVHVIDLNTGLEAPSQLVTIEGQRCLRVLAENVPSIGYKAYEIRPGAAGSFSDAASVSGNVIENDHYRITVADRGAITSLIDKTRNNREFVMEVDGRFINDLGQALGTLEVENAGPVSVTLLATSSSPLVHATRITLIRNSRRIDIRNDINQNFSGTYTWGFGFNLDTPEIWHEEVGAIILAKLLAQGGHYSPRNARYDWLTLNHFADISGGSGTTGLTLSNSDCYFMKVGNSTASSLDVTTPRVSVLAGGRVANGENGLPDQGGDSHFLQRFALQTHDGFDPVVAMRFALEHQNPLITGLVTGGSSYPEATYSFLTISDPNVLLWALKPADDGPQKGIIARVWNVSTNPVRFSLKLLSTSIIDATQTTHIETPLKSATVTNGVLESSLPTQGMRTFAITSCPEMLRGDINGDCALNLGDAILALSLMAGIESSEAFQKEGDVNGDGKVGTEEIIWILQKISGLR